MSLKQLASQSLNKSMSAPYLMASQSPSYASLTMSSLCLACKLTHEPFNITDIIDTLCKEADHLKAVKDLAQGQGKGKNRSTSQASDEALATTGIFEGRHRKGNCHYCGKPGHWAHECHTRKREEAAEAANQSMQAAQASLSSKPESKPVGSTNIVTINGLDSDDMGFWAIEEEEVHVCYTEPAFLMDNSDSDDDPDFHAKQEGNDVRLDWLDIEGEVWSIEHVACAYPNHAEPLMGDLNDDSDEEWEAFHTETWGAEDVAPHTLTFTNLAACLESASQLEGEQNFHVPCVGSELHAAPPVLRSNTLRCDLH